MTRPGDLQPQKLEHVEVGDAGAYVVDDAWAAEQKLDGVRVMARVGRGRLDFVGVGGIHIAHTATTQHFPALRRALAPLVESEGLELVLDGELLPHNGQYWLYDLPLYQREGMAGDGSQPEHEFHSRRLVLEEVFAAWTERLGAQVRLAPQARGERDKMDLFRAVHAAEAEGVVLKRLDAPYEAGARVRHQLKVKFVKTADCVVTARNVGSAANAKLAMYEGDRLRPVGGCSMIGKPDAQVGDVVEVKYLYATESLTLYQPTLLRVRHDKPADDCRIEQLRPVSKEVLA